jgi:hypothetical protein
LPLFISPEVAVFAEIASVVDGVAFDEKIGSDGPRGLKPPELIFISLRLPLFFAETAPFGI